MTVEILELLTRSLNFTVKRVQPSDRQWGALTTDPGSGNQSWNGMVRMLIDKEADICTAGLSMTKERGNVCIWLFYRIFLSPNRLYFFEVIDYNINLVRDLTTFVMVNPSTLGGISNVNFFAFMKVFHIDAWSFLFVITLIAAFCYATVKVFQQLSMSEYFLSFWDS